MKLVVLVSGGLDSSTLIYDLKKQGHEVAGLSILYGQRHDKEINAARLICQGLHVEHQIADLSGIQQFLAGSSQTSTDIEVPEGHYTEESMKLTVVPNRNMILLSVAMGWAISKKFDGVAYAAHGGDHAIYPDCRPEFVQKIAEIGKICDWHQIEIITPYVRWTKSQIVARGSELQVPFNQTWSCYKGLEAHCGKCGTCVERREAFELAGLTDPTVYRSEKAA